MHIVSERCCGIDVHKKFLVACLITLTPNGESKTDIRTFGTMTRDLLHLLDWLKGYADALVRLDEIPGVNRRIAEVVLSEIGIDMKRFPSAGHLASWAGMCPNNKVSAGKRLSSKSGKGCRWLRSALVEAAHGAARTKATYLGEQYRRLARRIGKKKALIAVAHSILVIIYHLLEDGSAYRELGPSYFEERESDAIKRRSVRNLERLGYHVSLEEIDNVA